MYYPALDEAIAAYLRREGKTQGQLAKELGMSENTLSWKRRGYRDGRPQDFTVGEVIRLREIIGAESIDALVSS